MKDNREYQIKLMERTGEGISRTGAGREPCCTDLAMLRGRRSGFVAAYTCGGEMAAGKF